MEFKNVVKKIMESEDLKYKLAKLKSFEEVHQFFSDNGYKGSAQGLRKELFERSGTAYETPDADLSSIAGGANGRKALAACAGIAMLLSTPTPLGINNAASAKPSAFFEQIWSKITRKTTKTDDTDKKPAHSKKQSPKNIMEGVNNALNQLAGRKAVKKQISDFFTYFTSEIEDTHNLPSPRILIFNGASGTGKTYTAQLLCDSLPDVPSYAISGKNISAVNNDPSSIPYQFFHSKCYASASHISANWSAQKGSLCDFLQSTKGQLRIVVVDEWDRMYGRYYKTDHYPDVHPLDETLRRIISNSVTDYNGRKIDLNGTVFIFTTNETSASLQGRVRVNPTTGVLEEALIDENGNPVLNEHREQVYGEPKRENSQPQTLVPHDQSLMEHIWGSICHFESLKVEDYEAIVRDVLGDDRSIKTLNDYLKAQRPDKVSLIRRLSSDIGGIIIPDKGYRLIAEYVSMRLKNAWSVMEKKYYTSSVAGNLDKAIVMYVGDMKKTAKNHKNIVLLAEPYETKDARGRRIIEFKISALGYIDKDHTYEQYLEEYKNK